MHATEAGYPSPALLGAAALLGLAVLVGIHLALAGTYWDYSEGVYALTSRLWLHGSALYSRTIAAQPPGVFIVGAGLLAIHDSLEWLRFSVAVLDLGAGVIGAVVVWRISRSKPATLLAPASLLLAPWLVREHGALLPELVALPVLMGAAAMSAQGRRAGAAGLLCGLLPLIKLPLFIPAVALVAISPKPRRCAVWAAMTLVIGVVSLLALAGSAAWRDVIEAQMQSGYHTLSVLGGYWAQAAWNLLGLLVAAAFAWLYRAQAVDRRLLRASGVLTIAMLVTLLSTIKLGTSLNVLVPVQAALMPLALLGATFAIRANRTLPVAVCVAGLLFTLAQSVALVVSPEDPVPFLRPASKQAWSVVASKPQLQSEVARARRCPVHSFYSGPPLVAMLAAREMPDRQPDQFIIGHAALLQNVQAKLAASRPLCPS
jgi:hypothetical protein